MRDIYKVNNVRAVIDNAKETLTVDTSAYSANDYLHDGILVFNVFPEATSGILLKKVIVREKLTTGTLARNSFNLLLFTACDFTVTKNGAFSWANATTTTLDDLCETVSVVTTDYVDQGTNNSIAIYNLSVPKLIHNRGLGRELYGICKAVTTTAYDATATLTIELIYEAL